MSMPGRRERANAIRMLSVDAVQKANSGHPGMPMGMADIAEVLWHDFLRHNPQDTHWINRDRFILSNGHGCMLLYALLHLTGYALSIDDIKSFRQLHSITPGHPEFGLTPGVETTTGPLGQGLANAVGMAIAEKQMAATFNRADFPIIDHYTYCFVGDGCLMEGISHEVASFAGTLKLGKLIVFYDDNGISIDGEIAPWFTDNTPERFRAYGWHVIENIDGHQSESIRNAIFAAHQETARPTLICCKTTIGFGSPALAGTAATHGAPLGEKEIAAVRQQLGWSYPAFEIPADIYASWNAHDKGQALEAEWNNLFARYSDAHPQLAQEFKRRFNHELPAKWQQETEKFVQSVNEKQQTIATRKASQLCLNHFANQLPEMMGGSADLTESNCTNWQGMELFSAANPTGRYIHYGVREFGMSAMMNGMALYGGMIPFGGTFLTFSDYARNAVRLAALMQQKVVFVYSHDSIGLGEDGPTHQPIEHLPSLRLIPNLAVWRPCDSVETAVSWGLAIERKGPTCLLLTRQNVAFQTRTPEQIKAIAQGGYILWEAKPGTTPAAILISTGSEVDLCMQAAKALQAENIAVRVVSMPSVETFLAQDVTYREQVLPTEAIERVVVEAAASDAWYRFVGFNGCVLGIDRFGASAPAKDVYKDCGLTVDRIVASTKDVIYSCSNPMNHNIKQCASG